MDVRPSSAGFTLVELCVLLVLFALLAGLAVPALSAGLARARARAVLDGVAVDLYLARSLAVRRGEPMRVRFEPAAGCAQLYEIVTDSGEVLRRVHTAPSRSGVCLASNVSWPLRVNGRGMLIGSARKLVTRSGSAAESASVSLVGRVHRW